MILDTIKADVKTAMKAKEKAKLTTLRGLHSDLKNIQINDGIEVTDEVALTVLSKNLKQQRDALEQFQAAERAELVEETLARIAVIETYMPKSLSEDEITEIVAAAIATSGATSPKDMGKVMPLVQPQVKGRSDGKLVSSIVKAQLNAL